MRALSYVIASFLHQIEHVLFCAKNLHYCARNLHKKILAASRYDKHASFLYKFLARLSPALERCAASRTAVGGSDREHIV